MFSLIFLTNGYVQWYPYDILFILLGHCSAFIMPWDLTLEKKKSIVDFGLFTSRWIDGITKELKMIT